MRENWMVMLLKDLHEVAKRDGLDASVDALAEAIDTLRIETTTRVSGASDHEATQSALPRTRH